MTHKPWASHGSCGSRKPRVFKRGGKVAKGPRKQVQLNETSLSILILDEFAGIRKKTPFLTRDQQREYEEKSKKLINWTKELANKYPESIGFIHDEAVNIMAKHGQHLFPVWPEMKAILEEMPKVLDFDIIDFNFS